MLTLSAFDRVQAGERAKEYRNWIEPANQKKCFKHVPIEVTSAEKLFRLISTAITYKSKMRFGLIDPLRFR